MDELATRKSPQITEYPAIAMLMPHGEAACGLSSILSHSNSGVECSAKAGQLTGSILVHGEKKVVSSISLFELIAQAGAVGKSLSLASAAKQGEGESISKESMAGTVVRLRNCRVEKDEVEFGRELIVSASWEESVAGAFHVSGAVAEAGSREMLCQARLTIFSKPEFSTR